VISALQLQGFRLRRLLIEPNNEFVFNEKQPQNDNSSLSFNFNFLQIPNTPAFNVPLAISVIAQPGSEANCRVLKLECEVEGIFVFQGQLNDEIVETLITNSLTVLYGTLRGLVLNATGLIHGGPYMLPALNFSEAAEKMVEEKRAQLEKLQQEGKAPAIEAASAG
jgi:preprotein translocase subunit SecB